MLINTDTQTHTASRKNEGKTIKPFLVMFIICARELRQNSKSKENNNSNVL